MSKIRHYQLAVIGGGSGGFACALAAARLGIRTVIVEQMDSLGGTATNGGVNCWEMGTGGTGIPFDLYAWMRNNAPDSIGIYSYGRHFRYRHRQYWPTEPAKMNFPGGEILIDPDRRYTDTLRRHPGPGQTKDETFCRETWHGVPFNPDAMATAMNEMLRQTGNVDILTRAVFDDIQETDDGVLRQIRLRTGETLIADFWADAAVGALCEACGCEILSGSESKSRFNEPSAPEEPSDHINGVTLTYRISKADTSDIESVPEGIPEECWWAPNFPLIQCVQNPDQSRTCNMLPTMDGREFLRLGHEKAYTECMRRVRAHWHFIQTHWPEFREYRILNISPMLGIRDEKRIVCERMLTENDLLAGLSSQMDPDIIAVNDHAMDRHPGGCREVDEPYGVPYRCLIPRGWKNLAVCCRSAGFSSIAASSCRLTRTMMQLGQAVGTAVSIAVSDQCLLPDLDTEKLRQSLHNQHVQLQWPISQKLMRHLSK